MLRCSHWIEVEFRTLPRDDDLLGLFLHGEGANQGGHFLGRFPLGQLSQTLLASPHRRVDDFQKQLPRARIEANQGAVQGFGGQIALERLVNGDAVDVGVVDEPDDLVGEEFAVVLGGEVGLGGLGAVQLEALTDALAQHVQRRIGLHDLGHGLLDQRLGAGEPVAVGAVQVVGQVDGDEHSGGGGVDGHVVGRVVEKFGTSVPERKKRKINP